MSFVLRQLIMWCFLPGQDPYLRERATLTVRGIDRDNDVGIPFDASIKFSQRGFQQYCDLEWMHLYDGDLSNFKSSDGSTLQLTDPSQPTEIKISIQVQRIVIESLHPNGLVSGKFIKAFAYDLATAWTTVFHSACYTVIENDYSSVRELYWLWKGQGKTYFEQEWGLEYDCVSTLPLPEQLAYKQMAAAAQDLPAILALGQNEFPNFRGYKEIEFDLEYSFPFDTRFIGALELYRQQKGPAAFEHMTIREVLREFMGTWTVEPEGMFTRPDITMLARNTFMYFFQNHTNFTDLARRVIQGMDSDCQRLSGIISNRSLEDVDRMYEITIRPPPGRHENSGGAGSSYGPLTQNSQAESVVASHHMNILYTYFTFPFFIMIIFILVAFWSIMDTGKETPHFDMYLEL